MYLIPGKTRSEVKNIKFWKFEGLCDCDVFATRLEKFKLENLNIWIFFSTVSIRIKNWLRIIHIVNHRSLMISLNIIHKNQQGSADHIVSNYSGINMLDYGQPVSLQYTKVQIPVSNSCRFQTLGPVVLFWTSSSNKILNFRILWRRATGFTCFLGAWFESIMHLPEKRFSSDDPASSWTIGAASAKRISH